MADNQHMRNQYRADTEDKDDDPLAELARFVEFEDDSDVPASSSEEPDLPDFSFDLESEFFADPEEGGTSNADAHLTSLKPDLGQTSHDIAEHVSFEQSIAAALELIADNPDVPDEEGYRQGEHEYGSEDPAFGEEDLSQDTEARLTDVREDDPATGDDETMPEFELSEEDLRAYPDSGDDAAVEMTVYEGVAENGENATESPDHLPAVDFDALFAGDIDNSDEPNSEANDDGSVERTGHLREELVRDIEEQSGLNSVVPDNSKAAPASQAWDSKGDMNRPTDHTKAEGEPENEFWPNAKREKDEEVLSLEAELQAAFDALEGKAASPPSAPSRPVSSGASLREPEPPSTREIRTGDAAKFTEALAQLQNAGRTRQTPAPQPVAQPERPPVPEREPPRMPSASNLPDPEPMSGDDDDMPLGDLLAAEMEAIENLTAESSRRTEEVPFNPAEIVEDVSAPEAMGTVEVPDHQFEEPSASVPLDEDLNLSLEDELAALSAEAEDHGYVQTDLKSEEEYYAQHADPAVAAELAAHASALSHDFGSHSIPGKEEIAAPDWDDQALDEEYEDIAGEVDDDYQPRQVEPEEWQPDDSEFDAGFSEVDFSEIDEPYEQRRNGRTSTPSQPW